MKSTISNLRFYLAINTGYWWWRLTGQRRLYDWAFWFGLSQNIKARLKALD